MRKPLFGPASPTFCIQDLGAATDAVLFDFDGRQPLKITPDMTWPDVVRSLPDGFEPDSLILQLPYKTIPLGLWSAPVPIIGLAPDWNLLYSNYRFQLARCDAVLTDGPGVGVFQRAGFRNVYQANLFGLEESFLADVPDLSLSRDIDILFVGNFQPAIQCERFRWLGKVGKLASRYSVFIAHGVFNSDYRKLLSRAKIVFNRSIRRECNQRVFEAIACGALLFQERDNLEVSTILEAGREYVAYREDDLTHQLEHYLSHASERRAIVAAAGSRISEFTYAALWNRATAILEQNWSDISRRGNVRLRDIVRPHLWSSLWQAVTGGDAAEISAAIDGSPSSALSISLGTLAPNAFEAAQNFRTAIELDPNNVAVGLNLVEALCRAGKNIEAITEARRWLDWCDSKVAPSEEMRDTPHYPPGFNLFHVQWERAGWTTAGEPHRELTVKKDLVRCWLHLFLGMLTGDIEQYQLASALKPEIPELHYQLGCALARNQRLQEARRHLEIAVDANPFDINASRALAQLLEDLGDHEEREKLRKARLTLNRAAPTLVPLEDWLAPPKLTGRELSTIIILACDQASLTRLCLDSVLKHTSGEFELILINNGSSDETADLFEATRSRPEPRRVVTVHNEQNRGFAAGVNQGFEVAQGQFLVLLNNDTIVTPGWLSGLISWILQDWPKIGMVGPVSNYTAPPQLITPEYSDLAGLEAFAAARRLQFAGQAINVGRLTGFCLLMRKDVLDAVGGCLDERFGLGFFEDDDLSARVRNAGYRMCVAQGIYIHHFGSQTFAGLGIDTARQLDDNYQLFRSKWGASIDAHYHVQPPASGNRVEQAASPGVVTASKLSSQTTEGSEPRPKVSLCMMVKNEEHNLADCLRFVREAVDEIIVVDTGSTDRTRELALSLGAKVFDFPWQDSFSAARNASISHARGEWIFWMDADDRLDDQNLIKLKNLISRLDNANRAFVMKCVCVSATPGDSATVVDHLRFFRNDRRIRWKYRIHEQILPALRATNAEVEWSDVTIVHVGYADPVLRHKKLERDLRLLLMELREQPEDAFTLFNVGSVLRELGRQEEAIPILRRSLERSNPRDSIVRKLYSQLVQIYLHFNRMDDALHECGIGLSLYPGDAELLFMEGSILHKLGDRRRAERSLKSLIDGKEELYFASVASGLRGFKARHNLAVMYLEEQRFEEAAAEWRKALNEQPQFFPASIGLAETYLQSRDWGMLTKQTEALSQLGPHGEVEAEAFRARALLEQNLTCAARDLLDAALARMPDAPQLQYLLKHPLLASEPVAEPSNAFCGQARPNHSADDELAVHVDEPIEQPFIAIGKTLRILFLCPDNPHPSGGVRMLYRHTDILRQAGYDAYILHQKLGFRCAWFPNETPIHALSRTPFTESDFLVIPEIFVNCLDSFPSSLPKVVFNQNAYLTFRGWPLEANNTEFYSRSNIRAILAVSDDNMNYLRFAFPNIPLHRVHYAIDPMFRPQWPKRRKIAYMPRKNAEDIAQVLNILDSRRSFTDWNLRSIDGVHETEVAKQLEDTAIFLSFGNPEGFSLPPCEAMACGCVVVGYHGRGGQEYFDPAFSYPIEAGDIIGFAKEIERVLKMEQQSPGSLMHIGQKASIYVRENYTPERERDDILNFWQSLLATP